MVFMVQIGEREPTRHEGAEEMERVLIGVLTRRGRSGHLAHSIAQGATRTLSKGGRFEPDRQIDRAGTPGAVRVWREEQAG